MKPRSLDPVILCELPLVRKILADEVWLEGERRRQAVPDDDPVVVDRVCAILLQEGARMRAAAIQGLTATTGLPPDERAAA